MLQHIMNDVLYPIWWFKHENQLRWGYLHSASFSVLYVQGSLSTWMFMSSEFSSLEHSKMLHGKYSFADASLKGCLHVTSSSSPSFNTCRLCFPVTFVTKCFKFCLCLDPTGRLMAWATFVLSLWIHSKWIAVFKLGFLQNKQSCAVSHILLVALFLCVLTVNWDFCVELSSFLFFSDARQVTSSGSVELYVFHEMTLFLCDDDDEEENDC